MQPNAVMIESNDGLIADLAVKRPLASESVVVYAGRDASCQFIKKVSGYAKAVRQSLTQVSSRRYTSHQRKHTKFELKFTGQLTR
jgi:hypothetical protein